MSGRIVRVGPVAVRVRARAAWTTALLVVVAVIIGCYAMTLGDLRIPVGDVLGAVVGTKGGFAATVVNTWRLPRVVAALVFGAALGVSGAIFQSLTRNPLGSPDVIGFSTGAYTGALLVLLVLGGNWVLAQAGALGGGLLTALVVTALSRRRGNSLRLVLVGVAVSAMLSSLNHWLLQRAELDQARAAAVFGAGSLNGVTWASVAPAAAVAVVAIVVALGLGRVVRTLELGDDTATALGLHVERWRVVLTVVGVALVAAATSVAGPVAFVALVAPQVARRITGTPGTDLAGGAALGAALLVGADLVAQHLFSPVQLPVGIVTGCLGGVYLAWLLMKESRR